MTALLRPRLPHSTDFGNADSSARALVHSSRHWCAEQRKCGFCCHPDAPPFLFLIGRKTIKRFTSIRLPATAAVLQGVRLAPGILAIDEADAINKRFPGLESIDVPAGAFRGRPPTPDDTVTTLAITYRFVAPNTMLDVVAGAIARSIFKTKAPAGSQNATRQSDRGVRPPSVGSNRSPPTITSRALGRRGALLKVPSIKV
jgi:hypothetical protein